MNMNVAGLINVNAIHHVGIRVSDLKLAEEFYQLLGFNREAGEEYPEHYALGLINQNRVRINLISNAIKNQRVQENILLDLELKYPGITHIAFLVEDILEVMEYLSNRGIPISEGPLLIKQRICIFIRDPDGTVIEFNHIMDAK